MKAAETNGTDYVKVVLKMVVKENAMNAKKQVGKKEESSFGEHWNEYQGHYNELVDLQNWKVEEHSFVMIPMFGKRLAFLERTIFFLTGSGYPILGCPN